VIGAPAAPPGPAPEGPAAGSPGAPGASAAAGPPASAAPAAGPSDTGAASVPAEAMRGGGPPTPAGGLPASAAPAAGRDAAAVAEPRWRRWAWVGFAAASGVGWGMCFAARPHSLLAWAGLAPLVVLLGRPRAGRLGFVHGLAAWMTSLAWIVPTLETFGKMPWVAAVPLTGLLAGYLALYHAAFAWLGQPIWLRPGPLAPFAPFAGMVALPSLWVALEWARTYLGGGFPWNLAAYAWVEVPAALPLAAWIGAYGISWLVLWVAAGAAAALARRRWQPLLAGLALPLLLLPLAGRWSLRLAAVERARAREAGLPVRLVQPNVPDLVDPDPGTVLRNFQKVVELSLSVCEPGALVVWPESAEWPFVLHRDPILDRAIAQLLARGCTLVVNSEAPAPLAPLTPLRPSLPLPTARGGARESLYTSIFLLAPGAAAEPRYDKRHLVPFGEYVPFRWAFFFVDKLGRGIAEFRPGERVVLLTWRGEALGPSICYEVVFPEEVAETTRAGATLLLSVTNDAWYGDTAAPWQHFRAVRFRAAENRRPFLRAAITGVSAVVAPDGSVAALLGPFRQGVIRAEVAGESVLTPYTRWPWLLPALASAAALLAVYSSRRRS
jgi:apolipoprotein N-acyltransferase